MNVSVRVSFGVVALVATLNGAALGDDRASVEATGAESDLTEGRKALVAGDAQRAAALLEAFVKARPKHPAIDEAVFLLGRARVSAGDVREGSRTFARFLRLYPESPFAPDAWLEYGQSLAKLKQARDAAYAFGEAKRLHRDEKRRALAEAELAKLEPAQPPIDSLPADEEAVRAARLANHMGEFAVARRWANNYLEKFAAGGAADEMKALKAQLDALEGVNMTRVGVIAPLSGPGKAFGRRILEGVRLRADALSRIDVVKCDSGGDATRARACVDKLVFDERVAAIVGPIGIEESLGAVDRANELGVPIVTLTPREGITERGPWVFRVYLTNEQQGRFMAAYAMEKLEYKRFAILHPNSRYGQSLARAFWDEVERRGGEIRGVEEYDLLAVNDNASALNEPIQRLVGRYWLHLRGKDVEEARKHLAKTRLKGKMRHRKEGRSLIHEVKPVLDFEALFIPDYASSIKLVAPYLSYWDVEFYTDAKWKLQRIKDKWGGKIPQLVRLLGADGWNSEIVSKRVGDFTHMALFCDGWAPGADHAETEEFVKAYRARHTRAATFVAAVAYDAMGIVGRALKNGNPIDRAAVRDAILAMKDFNGATGKTSFAGKPDATKELFLFTVGKKGGSKAGMDPVYEIQPAKDPN